MKLQDIEKVTDYTVEEDFDNPNDVSVVLTVKLKNKGKYKETPYIAVSYSDGEYCGCMLWNSNYDWIDEDLSKDVKKFARDYVEKNVEL